MTDEALAWIRLHADRHHFLWLHYLDPHAPYAPPPDLLNGVPPSVGIGMSFDHPHHIREGSFAPNTEEREWMRELYDAEARDVDAHLGRLIDQLIELGLYDDTLIVLTSDHAEEFWEHDGYEHGHSLFGEVLRVPLIVKLPRGATPSRVETPVSTQSLFATILEVCGLESPLFSTPSLAPLWQGPESSPRTVVSSSLLYFDDQISVVYGRRKYVRNESTGVAVVFDLEGDPGETRSFADESPEALERGRELIQLHKQAGGRLQRTLEVAEPDSIQVDEQTKALLRRLGYVD